jgi:hypothetical protein
VGEATGPPAAIVSAAGIVPSLKKQVAVATDEYNPITSPPFTLIGLAMLKVAIPPAGNVSLSNPTTVYEDTPLGRSARKVRGVPAVAPVALVLHDVIAPRLREPCTGMTSRSLVARRTRQSRRMVPPLFLTAALSCRA